MKMNKTMTPLGTKIIGKMVDGYVEKKTLGGLIIQDEDATVEAIRPRWFEVTHVGPDQIDVAVGDWVLVEQGRWTSVLYFYQTNRKVDYLFRIDEEGMIGTSNTDPMDEYGTI